MYARPKEGVTTINSRPGGSTRNDEEEKNLTGGHQATCRIAVVRLCDAHRSFVKWLPHPVPRQWTAGPSCVVGEEPSSPASDSNKGGLGLGRLRCCCCRVVRLFCPMWCLDCLTATPIEQRAKHRIAAHPHTYLLILCPLFASLPALVRLGELQPFGVTLLLSPNTVTEYTKSLGSLVYARADWLAPSHCASQCCASHIGPDSDSYLTHPRHRPRSCISSLYLAAC